MKRTILRATMLAAIASLAMSGYVSADHMAADEANEIELPNDNHDDRMEQFEEDGDFLGDAQMAADGDMSTEDTSAMYSNQSKTRDSGINPLQNSASVSQTSNQTGANRGM